jgi:regulator of RNase E activity RraA
VEIFGTKVKPGQLIHADKHGFMVIPPEDETSLMDAAQYMDTNEINHKIRAAREATGKKLTEILDDLDEAGSAFSEDTHKKFRK